MRLRIIGGKKTCSKCGKPKEKSRGKQRYCKSCHAANMRENRPKHSELTQEQRDKANARAYVKVYLTRGKIIKMPCVICGNKKSQMRHEDYSKPLVVIWFCRKHHLQHHKLSQTQPIQPTAIAQQNQDN